MLSTYAVGEELGWRGFLQDALRPLAPGVRFALIGVLWGAWHFTTFIHGTPGAVCARLSLMLALWVGGSWGLGLLADRTASVLVTAAVHLVFNYLTLFPGRTCLAVLVPSLGAWVVLLHRWPPDCAFQRTEAGHGAASNIPA